MFPIIGRSGQKCHCRLPISNCRVRRWLRMSSTANRRFENLKMNITSRDNSLLRHARTVRDGKVDDTVFVEGLRLCEEALSSGLEIEAVIYSEELKRKERAASLIEQLAAATENNASVSEKLLESISYTKTPQGIVVLAARPANDEATY